MDLFAGMRAFCAVVEVGSLSKAAIRLGMSKSMMSRRIEQLEGELRIPLFHRAPGLVSLSDAGREYYTECSAILARVQALQLVGRDAQAALTGRLTLQVLPGFALGPFGKALHHFCAAHPGIAFDVTVSDSLVDPVREGFDLVFHIYPAVNDMLVDRKLFSHPGVFCASPAYLEQAPPLERPEDLLQHRFGRYANYPWGDRWPLQRDDDRVEIELTPILRTNSIHLLLQYVLDGSGVAYLPTMLAADHIRSGAITVVLPDYAAPPLWMHAIYPPSHRSTVKVRLFLDFIARRFADGGAWAEGSPAG